MLAKKSKKIEKKMKTPKQMERHLKGISNHNRIAILLAVSENPGIVLENIITKTRGNPKTIGEHARRLQQAGLINKKYQGHFVRHELSPYGKLFVRFLKTFQLK